MQAELFKYTIEQRLFKAFRDGKKHIYITSEDVHRKVGGYPGTNHKMPICCDAMYSKIKVGDEVLYAPP
jgi:5-methylcytosine-specific restriction protein A